ncbi:hypothetical protein ACFFJN_04430 [Erwinia mallotivora]|uniref:hypothetical protein n=1 Tax=Erwinia mallotivora TaxID=69222 RepID=UPI0035EA5C02
MGLVNNQCDVYSRKIYNKLSTEYINGEKKNPEGFQKNLSSVGNTNEDKPILTKPELLVSSSPKTSDTMLNLIVAKIKSVFGISTNQQVNASNEDVEKQLFLRDGKTFKMTPEQENTEKNNNSGAGKNNSTVKKIFMYSAATVATLGVGYLAYQSLFGENSSHDGWLPDGLKPDNSSDMSTIAGLEEGISQPFSAWQSEYSASPEANFGSGYTELAASGDGYDYDGEYGDDYDGIDGSGDKIYF